MCEMFDNLVKGLREQYLSPCSVRVVVCVCVFEADGILCPLSQIVNLIEETGHFNVTNTTFDFDLFSLDESTVRKLQSYLEATAT